MYTNPIILCDYSDPDVIRYEDDYFMVASSFNFTPGLPILHSKNLVDWNLVNYAAENIPVSRYTYPQNAQGIWAPSFAVHNKKFYIVVGLPDEGIFITETENPLEKWSPLKMIYSAKGFIDPCLFFDDNGKAYIIHAFAKSRCGFNSKLGMLSFDLDNLKCTGDDKIIFDGTKTQPTIEGPKIYKKNDFYYIFAPAGGVTDGWQTVLRSKTIEGPYEEKIVLAEGESKINGPHQGALVDTPFGEEWFIHFSDRGIFGRVTFLEPVKWKDDWPLIGTAVKTEQIPGEPVLQYRSPKAKYIKKTNFESAKHTAAFENANLCWQWSGNHEDSYAKVAGSVGGDIESFKVSILNVSAYSQDLFPILWNSSNVLTQKINYENFYFVANIDSTSLPVSCRTGILFMGEEYASVAIERTKEGLDLVYLKSDNFYLTDSKRRETEVARIPLPQFNEENGIKFRMDFTPLSMYSGAVQFTVKAGNFFKKFKWKSDYFSTENAHWVGGRYGIYAVGNIDGSVLFYNIKTRH